MNVPMGQSQAITGSAVVPPDVAPDFRLIIGTGHYHSHTTEFKAWATVDGVTDAASSTTSIRSATRPIRRPGTSTARRRTPSDEPSTQAGGAYSGIVHMQPGDTIDWECDVTNDNVPGGLKFGNSVYTGEMCNMFGLYAPSFGRPWQAFNP